MTSDAGDVTPPSDLAGQGADGVGGGASSGQVGRHTMVMAAGTLVSRVLGLVRGAVLGAAVLVATI